MYLTNRENYYSFLNLVLNDDFKAINQLIYQEKIDLNVYPNSSDGKPILHFLNKFKSASMIYFLVDNGANVDIVHEEDKFNQQQQNALIVACTTFKPQMLKALLDCGANPNLPNVFNEHALFYCKINSMGNELHKQDVFDCVDLLLGADINLDQKNSDSNASVLDQLEFQEQFELAHYIIDKIGSEKAKAILNNPDSTLNDYIEAVQIREEKAQLEQVVETKALSKNNVKI